MNNLPLKSPTFQKTEARNWRDEMVQEFVKGINTMREKEGWSYTDKNGKKRKLKPVTAKQVALRLNRNPFTKGKKNDGEVFYILQQCREKSYQQFFFRT